jgi:hypothetical protein
MWYRTVLLLLLFVLTGCSLQRAQEAEQAKAQMIGMPKEAVFACMGPPAQKSSEGATEIWSYPSGNRRVDTVTSFGGSTSGGAVYGAGVGVSRARFCVVNLVIVDGNVQAVNYNGPTGGLLTHGEQCAYAIENCLKHGGS